MLRILSLQMNHLDHPRGLESLPAFTWVLESSHPCAFQTAYRLQLSLDPDFSRILLDTGRVEDGQSAHVRLPDMPLQPCTAHYVRVMAWAGEEESPWYPGHFLSGMTQGWKARFITAEQEADWLNSAGTYLRSSFRVHGKLRQAVLCATAHGLYHLYLNGREVGEEKMLPGWTSYHHHLCYQTWEVTDRILQGENVLGAHLGAGWYKGMMGFIHERCAWGENTALLAQLCLRYEDGHEEWVCTDRSWLGCHSPVTFSEIYDGERVDARLEQAGWNAPGFECATGEALRLPLPERRRTLSDPPYTREEKEKHRRDAQEYRPGDTLWRPVRLLPESPENLTAQAGGTCRVHETFPVLQVLRDPDGHAILDFGQNLTGYVRFRVRGKSGDLAHIRCFEILHEGRPYFDNLRGALAEIRFTLGGEGEYTWDELFSFQGFRYALIQSWPGEVDPGDFTACAVYSDMRRTGSFDCGHPLVQKLQHNITWSLQGNFLDIPTDCPQRDERMGWTGDAQIFCRTALFLRDCHPFFEKWLLDVRSDQTEEGGIPHMVPNQLQYFNTDDWLVSQGTHSAAGWADVCTVLPWNLYLTGGDPDILRRHLPMMEAWVRFMENHSRDCHFSYRLQLGDWVALDAESGSYFGRTPLPLTSMGYFALSTSIVLQACRVLGERKKEQYYRDLYDRIRLRFREDFLDEKGVMKVDTQTAHIMALYLDLIPEAGIPATFENLLRLLDRENGHLVTGFMGTPWFCHVLSAHAPRRAYDLLLKEDYPSWLYQVLKGATTVWEHWDGLKPDGTLWSPDMNSFNHYAYGAVGDWLYRVAAGIDTDAECPGYRHILLSPRTDPRLQFVRASHESPYGLICSEWTREADRVTLRVTLPVNTETTITLEKGARDVRSDLPFALSGGLWQARTGSGTHEISYAMTE